MHKGMYLKMQILLHIRRVFLQEKTFTKRLLLYPSGPKYNLKQVYSYNIFYYIIHKIYIDILKTLKVYKYK